jgi:ATP-dependent Zn protease
VPLDDPNDDILWKIARGTTGFSGAELSNIINQAALKASIDRLSAVDLATLEWAKDKIMMGSEACHDPCTAPLRTRVVCAACVWSLSAHAPL